VRDLLRCRDALRRDVLRWRHRVLKVLARHGRVYQAGKNWSQAHWRWIREQRFALPALQRTVQAALVALEGQEIDITGLPVGIYYLVSTANPDRTFTEAGVNNNTAWVSFWLLRDRHGNARLVEISHSPCDTPGMCGEQATNR